MPVIGLQNFFLLTGVVLFCIGVIGFLIRRNLIICFMCIELMLNGVNLVFITYAHYLKSAIGMMYVLFVMAIAAAEVSIGLAIILMVFRLKASVDMDELNTMRG
ncbi:MAG TPA: NADH-quinone oxidoreductase subunit NuoK [Thermodesulforhabdus norvegica]|uniref:NADH-quinone oxidoreductase subunit K n=1 Tax=Thermodesulforhabdus norvegica TaxID=39841 RepID=A0A7C1AYN1_9BACT|nr:NADH-quinone oxidoreductase subunit NuoK [Deltaproteobacteria bacterium]MBW2067882.1 NADH-quinone oxidoreductase subunit NuoK [Deltaproteobacteria bacterium]HDL90202.1 NADH-quinone oxidoreductase subunit NuoK [Thermodesulforhabdus norvegica]